MMASTIASSSRSIVLRSSNRAQANNVRGFASSSRIGQREISFRIANVKATLELPSLSTWLGRLLPASVEESSQLPSLAGVSGSLSQSDFNSEDILEWDGVLNAVPKSKISHSRKRMRSANKGLKDKNNFVHCAACGRPKLSHHICAHCYGFISRTQKQEARSSQQPEQPRE